MKEEKLNWFDDMGNYVKKKMHELASIDMQMKLVHADAELIKQGKGKNMH